MSAKDRDPENVERGQRLRRIRESLGLSQPEMAELCGTSKTTYNGWETGANRIGLSNAISIKQKLGVSLDYLYFGEVPIKPASAIKAGASRS
jgi:transcriptional regulator with XRE-family HTH domain